MSGYGGVRCSLPCCERHQNVAFRFAFGANPTGYHTNDLALSRVSLGISLPHPVTASMARFQSLTHNKVISVTIRIYP